ncbi:DUF4198 domain-containing protein [Pseudaestuariivita sp.]|uniref:DUF4198 domain-containing protein n=1 Tax=Pseudaestuariivita sp. TaxID=2211669 RepID=UPI0040583EEB
MRMFSLTAALCAACLATPARAHEVWLELSGWTLAPQESFSARLINGHDFEGVELPWNPRSVRRAEMWHGADGFRLVGRPGDRPAIETKAGPEGLLTLVYAPTYNTIVYDTFEKFAGFAESKGQLDAVAAHRSEGLPEERIRETYARFVKALAAVGDGAGADRAYGFELEIVALDNPYTADPGAPLRFQLLYREAPLAGNQVMLLTRDAEGTVRKTLQQSDANGTVSFAPERGSVHLVDSVILRKPAPELAARARDAVWESLWASLTFGAPGQAQ